MTRAPRHLVAVVISIALVGVVPAATAGDLDDDLQGVRSRIESLSGQIDAVSGTRTALARDIQDTEERMSQVLESLEKLREDLLAVVSVIGERRRALRDVRSDLHAQYQALALTRSELGTARDDVVDHALETYMGAGLGVPTIALSAKVWADIGIGLVYLDQIAADGADTVERFEGLLDDERRARDAIAAREASLSSDLVDLEAAEQGLATMQNELHRSSEDLQNEYRRQRSLLAQYDAVIEEIEGEIASLEREQASIKRLIEQQAKSAGTAPGSLVRPVPGAITSGFGPRIHPIYGYTRMHNGVDMNGATGQAIVAAGSGTVIFAAVKGGYGNTVMIDHGGGMVTLYAHQSRFAVAAGQRVGAGQVIGYVGSTGVSTGPHLHFEVRIKGDPVNPSKYI